MSCPSEIQVENWLDLDRFDDPELKKLADLLPSIIIQDRAEGTIKTYISAYRLWKRWACTHGVCPIPADGTALALYIVLPTLVTLLLYFPILCFSSTTISTHLPNSYGNT